LAQFCPELVEGVVGMAASFDGVDDHLSVPDAPRFQLGDDLTFAMWLRPDPEAPPGSEIQVVLGKAFGAVLDNSFELIIQLSAQDEQITKFKIAGAVGPKLSLPVPDEAWHHIAGTWNGATMRLYQDGVIVREDLVEGENIAYDSHPITVGGDVNEGSLSLPFRGAIDDLRIYRIALEPSEVALLAAP
jgi:hypothetical protein